MKWIVHCSICLYICTGHIVLPLSPRGQPRGHNFLGGCNGLFITLFLSCPILINHFNPFIFECPALFHFIFECPALLHHTHFSSKPGATPQGGMGAEQFDQRIRNIVPAFTIKVQNIWKYKIRNERKCNKNLKSLQNQTLINACNTCTILGAA